jgi:hypothetical protein
MNGGLKGLIGALLAQLLAATCIYAQGAPAASQAQQVLAAAAAEQKYTFLVFYKDNGPATQAMAQTVKQGVESRGNRATLAYVNVASPTEKALVDRFGVSRAPMPLTVTVAPNGAMTKLTPSAITDKQIEESFVTPVMAQCMKSMQDGRLVLICVQSGPRPTIPAAVVGFANDPEFKSRVAVVPLKTSDPAEGELIRQLEADSLTKGATTVFMAPPGVLVGKFGPATTKEQLAVALHKAGQCCDDPNCKHNQAAQQANQPAAGAARQPQSTGARR